MIAYSRQIQALCFVVATLLCQSAAGQKLDEGDLVARAAIYIYDQDFIQDSPGYTFTEVELEYLESRKDLLLEMIQQALMNGPSVGGADFVGHFRLYDAASRLRARFFEPGIAYGWEGPDYSDPEAILGDNQYVFHHRYYNALHALYGDDLIAELGVTDAEMETIVNLSLQPDGAHYNWARWVRKKLGF